MATTKPLRRLTSASAASDQQAHVKPPQQERSRQSLERALDAAAELLAERRSDSFTLAEVAERADVSIGSIYGRVKSKDDLIRSVQVRELARIDEEVVREFGRSSDLSDLTFAVDFAVRAVASVLRGNAEVLGAFMVLANSDAVIKAAGSDGHQVLVDQYFRALLAHKASITHRNPSDAIQWTFTVVFSVLARYLGLGSSPESAGEGDWDQMVEHLVEMTVSFLTSPPRKSSGKTRRSAVHVRAGGSMRPHTEVR